MLLFIAASSTFHISVFLLFVFPACQPGEQCTSTIQNAFHFDLTIIRQDEKHSLCTNSITSSLCRWTIYLLHHQNLLTWLGTHYYPLVSVYLSLVILCKENVHVLISVMHSPLIYYFPFCCGARSNERLFKRDFFSPLHILHHTEIYKPEMFITDMYSMKSQFLNHCKNKL